MLEKTLESMGVAYARDLGWVVFKMSSPGSRGAHDRIHHKNGLTFYIEYKAPRKKATPLQLRFARDVSSAGVPSKCCDSLVSAKEFIDAMDKLLRVPMEKRMALYFAYSKDVSSFYA